MIIIGEKLNGAISAVARAIAGKDGEFVRQRAADQAAAGATYIDVHASVEERIEDETLGWMLKLVQETTEVPICVDSPSARICALSIPKCRKEGLVNSVSMEGGKTDIIFPVIADSAWECIALLCDDSGIPKSVEDRMRVFEKIMEKAEEYGIAPCRLHIDPLVEAIGTNPESFSMFSECCRRIRSKYPDIHITSGLSNISFGLPSRKHMNLAFLALAMVSGMDSAIMDPLNKDMTGVIKAMETLMSVRVPELVAVGKMQEAESEYRECCLKHGAGFEQKHLDMAWLALCKGSGRECSVDISYDRDLIGVSYAMDVLSEEDEYCIEYIGAYREGEFGVLKEGKHV